MKKKTKRKGIMVIKKICGSERYTKKYKRCFNGIGKGGGAHFKLHSITIPWETI